MNKTIKYINFNIKQNPELISKLNAVALRERRPVHNLVKLILTDGLDKRIKEFDAKLAIEATSQLNDHDNSNQPVSNTG
jgi:hypothetical protein